MNEKMRIKQELIRNTVVLFVVFAVLFAVLGVFIYHFVSINIYRSVDEQLSATGSTLLIPAIGTVGATEGAPELSSSTDSVTNGVIDPGETPEMPYAQSIEPPKEQALGEDSSNNGTGNAGDSAAAPAASVTLSNQISTDIIAANPQLIYLFRDENGAPLNTQGIYSVYPDYLNSIPFDSKNLNQIYSISADEHTYHGINYVVDDTDGTNAYIQAIVAVDSEILILDQFSRTLVVGLSIALIIAAAASYLLSRRTMKPIVAAWNKQTEFVQNASHELRTPLTIIRTTQELLLDCPDEKIIDRFEDVSITIEETKRLSRLVEDLSLLTAADSAHLSEEKEPVVLDTLLVDLVATYSDYVAVQEKTLSLDTCSGAKVLADADKLRQLFGIVVDNSLKHTRAGDTIAIVTSEKNGKCITEITDTGCGIPDDDINHVFERFYQGDKAHSRETGGNGLGLSIARSIAEAHNGTITLDHHHPQGVIATITLPKLHG